MAHADILTLFDETTFHFYWHRCIGIADDIAHLLNILNVHNKGFLVFREVLTIITTDIDVVAIKHCLYSACSLKELVASFFTALEFDVLLIAILAKVEALWCSNPVDVDHEDVVAFLCKVFIMELKESVSSVNFTCGKCA